MMENEFCEIDFTTATPWESLNAQLEEIFYGWKLYESSNSNSHSQQHECFKCEIGVWNVNHKSLQVEGKEYILSYYYRPTLHDCGTIGKERSESVSDTHEKTELNNESNFLPLKINCLSKHAQKSDEKSKIMKIIQLFNLDDFVVLTAENESAISSESSIKLLLSSFCISCFNTRSYLPIFVQVFQTWQQCFTGVRVDEDGFRFDYQMIHLGKIPPKLNYFSGILDLFKSKTSSSPMNSNNCWSSVKLSYFLSDFTNFAWPRFKRPLNSEDVLDEPTQLPFELPFGAASEPVDEIQLHVTWPKVFENMVLDNEHHTDFDPQNASNWILKVLFKPTHHLLGQHLFKSLQQCHSLLLMSEPIGDLLKQRNFNDLNVPVPTNLSFSRIISGNSNSNEYDIKRTKKFLPEETLLSILYFLFPDADSSNSHPYPSNFSDDKNDSSLKGMKTCGIDELPWRLSVMMCIIVENYGSFAAAQFWYEFTQELRFRWEKNVRILGVKKGTPNHKSSLLNQKLQMLNCCIRKKIKREDNATFSDDSNNAECPAGKDSDDEEFFDCQTEYKEQKVDHFKTACTSIWEQPEGRLRKFNNLRLLENGEFMYIPVTQEMTPKTEDQLEDDALVLMKLGSDSQGSQLRARMMCASLYSDMESFKAANPGAILEDFIRWYSPRDWIEEENGELDNFEQKKGKLSNRMQLPGNMWKEVWDTSFPVPACRQKCLFDDVNESEKVLHFFEQCKTLGEVFSLLMPTLIHAAVSTLISNETLSLLRKKSSFVEEKITNLVQKCVAVTRNHTVDLSQYEVVVGDISDIESLITKYKSIEFKLFPQDSFADNKIKDEENMLIDLILGKSQTMIPGASNSRLGRRIIFLFAKENDNRFEGAYNGDKKKDDSNSIVNDTKDFLNSATSFNTNLSHQQSDYWQTITCPPYQKEFILHLDAPLPSNSSRISSHCLTAHICSEEILISSCIGRDLMFI